MNNAHRVALSWYIAESTHLTAYNKNSPGKETIHDALNPNTITSIIRYQHHLGREKQDDYGAIQRLQVRKVRGAQHFHGRIAVDRQETVEGHLSTLSMHA